MFNRWLQIAVSLIWIATAPYGVQLAQAAQSMDTIVAVVDEGVILESELVDKLTLVKRDLRQRGTSLPPDDVLVRQVLESLIMDKIQEQMAERGGIKADEETVRGRVQQIAERNRMTIDEFRNNLASEGFAYADFLDQVRKDIIIQRLRGSQVYSQIKVSEREVDAYLKEKGVSGGTDPDYLLGHILIATPRAASPEEVQKAKERADKLVADIKNGTDFRQAALTSSDDDQALKGGDLGWRKKSQLPALFVEYVDKMKEGDVQGPIRSSSGYHIIKLLGYKSGGGHIVNKTKVRHILIKTTEVMDDEEAKQKLLLLRRRIENGEDFATVARGHSDDKGSAIKGGDLGWVQPGALVPPFEDAMERLKLNEMSEPVQTQFGWHLIQVLERQQSADSGESERNKAKDEIFKRKAEEETELWLRRIRDEAYVEIRLQ